MSDPLFSIVINDLGQMSVAVRKDFWEHEDQDVMLQVLTIATFLMSDNDKVIEAKNVFVEACSDAFDRKEEGIVPQEFTELRGFTVGDADFELDGDMYVHPLGEEVH